MMNPNTITMGSNDNTYIAVQKVLDTIQIQTLAKNRDAHQTPETVRPSISKPYVAFEGVPSITMREVGKEYGA